MRINTEAEKFTSCMSVTFTVIPVELPSIHPTRWLSATSGRLYSEVFACSDAGLAADNATAAAAAGCWPHLATGSGREASVYLQVQFPLPE